MHNAFALHSKLSDDHLLSSALSLVSIAQSTVDHAFLSAFLVLLSELLYGIWTRWQESRKTEYAYL